MYLELGDQKLFQTYFIFIKGFGSFYMYMAYCQFHRKWKLVIFDIHVVWLLNSRILIESGLCWKV